MTKTILVPLDGSPLAEAAPDYEVEMVGGDPADGSYVVRRHGRFYSQERREPGERWWNHRSYELLVDEWTPAAA